MPTPDRTIQGLYDNLNRLSEEQNVDIGMANYRDAQQFGNRYGTQDGLREVYGKLKQLRGEGYDLTIPDNEDEFVNSFGEVKPQKIAQDESDFVMKESELERGNEPQQPAQMPEQQPAQQAPTTKTRQAGKVENVVKTDERDGMKLRYYEEGGKRIYNPDDVRNWQEKTQGVSDVQEQLPMGMTQFQWQQLPEEVRAQYRNQMREQSKTFGGATGVTSGTLPVDGIDVAKSAGEWEGAVSRRQRVENQNAFRASGGVQKQQERQGEIAKQQEAVDALPSALSSLKSLEQAGVDANTSLQFNPDTGRLENMASMVDVAVTDEEGNQYQVDEEGNVFSSEKERENYRYQKAQENIARARLSREIEARDAYRNSHAAPTSEPEREQYESAEDYAQAKAWWEEITSSMSLPTRLEDESEESWLMRVQSYMDRKRQWYEQRIEGASSDADFWHPSLFPAAALASTQTPHGERKHDVLMEYAQWADDMRYMFPELTESKFSSNMEVLFNPILRLGRSEAELIANAAETLGKNLVSDYLHGFVDASHEREGRRIITNGIGQLWNEYGTILSTAALGGGGMTLLITTGAGDQAYQARVNGATALGASVAGASNALIWTAASRLVGIPLTNKIFNNIGKAQGTRVLEYINKVLGGANKNAAAASRMKIAMNDFIYKAEHTMQVALTKEVKANLMAIASGTFRSTLDMATASALCQFICLWDGEKIMKTDEYGNIVEAEGISKLTTAGENALVGLKEGAIDGALFGLFFGAFGHGSRMFKDRMALRGIVEFTPEEVKKLGVEDPYSTETDIVLGQHEGLGAVIILGKSKSRGFVKCMLANGRYVDLPVEDANGRPTFSLIKAMKKDVFMQHLDDAVNEYYNGELDNLPDVDSEVAKSKIRYGNAISRINEVSDWSEEELDALRGGYKNIGQAIMDGKFTEAHAPIVEEFQQAMKEYNERLFGARRRVQEAEELLRKEIDTIAYVSKNGKKPEHIVECLITKGVPDGENPHRGYVLTGEYEGSGEGIVVYDAVEGVKKMMQQGDVEITNVRRIDKLIEQRKAEAEQAAAAKIDGDVTNYLREGADEFPIMIDGETRYAKFIGWDAEGRAVLRLPNGDQFAETREEVQEQYKKAVLYSVRTFDMEEGKLRVTAFDNSEMESKPVGLVAMEAPAEEAATKAEPEPGEPSVRSEKPKAGRYEAGNYFDSVIDGRPVEIEIEDVVDGEDGKQYKVNIFDRETGREESKWYNEAELKRLYGEEEKAETEAMPMIEVDGKQKADWYGATPERAASYIYNERGWTEQEADEFVRMRREAAEKELEDLKSKQPKMGLDEDEYDAKKAEWQASLNEAQRKAGHWKNIEQARKNQLAAEAKNAFKEAVDEANYIREQDEIEERGGLVKSEVADNSLSPVWREALHGLGRHVGRKIVIVGREDAERVLGDRESEGMYDSNTNTLYINEAYIEGDEAMLRYISGHEMTHALKDENPEVWDRFVDVVKAAIGEEEFGKRVKEKTELYNEVIDRINERGGLNGRKLQHLSENAAKEEVCAKWAGENILTDIDAVRRIIDEAEKAGGDSKTLIKRVLDWIDGVLGSLKAALDRGENVQAQYDAVAKAKEMWQNMYNIAAAKERERVGAETSEQGTGRTQEVAPEGVPKPVAEELAKHGLTIDGGAVMSVDAKELKSKTGYKTPIETTEEDAVSFSFATMPNWIRSFINGNGKLPQKRIKEITDVVELWYQMAAADDAIQNYISYGVYPGGDLNKDGKGPLRKNVEYIYTFDLDTTCPRTFQYLNYVDNIEALLGRPMSQREMIILIESMRAMGQMIPCTYCYAENKRQALKQYYLNFISFRNNVMSAATDEEAKSKMYGIDSKGELSKAAADTFKRWRGNDSLNSYRPNISMLVTHYNQARNVILSDLDMLNERGVIDANVSDAKLTSMLCERYGIPQGSKASREDKGRAKSIANIVNEWRYDTIENTPHKNFTEMSGMADFNLYALALWDEMCKYGASASSAKNVVKYYPYTDELQGVSKEDRDYINGMGGLRMHSTNDFRIDYVGDYFQLLADMAKGGWKGHTYSKNPDFVRIFGNTGYRINMSLAAYDVNGKVEMNQEEGFNWEEARRLREQFPNAGTMFMTTSRAQLQYALDADWIDMIIPFHSSGLPKEVWYNMRRWEDAQSVQNESFFSTDDKKARLLGKGIDIPKKASAKEIDKLYNKHFKTIEVYDNTSEMKEELKQAGQTVAQGISYDELKKQYKDFFGHPCKAKGKRIRPHFLPGDTKVGGNTIPGWHIKGETEEQGVRRYFELCEKYGAKPRFYGIRVKDKSGNEIDVTEHPGYIKLIKETARMDREQKPIEFNLDQPNPMLDEWMGGKNPTTGKSWTPMEYAMAKLREFAEQGGYSNLKEDPYGVVEDFMKNVVQYERETGEQRPIDYISPDARMMWNIIRRGADAAAMSESEMIGDIPYHPAEPRFSIADNKKPEEEQTKVIFDAAKKKFGKTYDIREAGYVLPDGTMLDFSGRHELLGADDTFLKGRRTTDHRQIKDIAYEYDAEGNESETGIETNMPDFIERGAIRIDDNAGTINLIVKPTREQRDVLRSLINRNGGDVTVDFGNGWDTETYAEYYEGKAQRILNDIDRYFDEGIKPRGDEIRFSFAGEIGAAEADRAEGVVTRMEGLATAKQMEEDGRPALNIKMATGWERGKDGKWRYEMPDLKLKQKPEDMMQGTERLSDIADAPELFAAYPSLKDVWVEVYDDPSTGKRGDTMIRRVKDTEAYEMATKRLSTYPTYESYLASLEESRNKYAEKAKEDDIYKKFAEETDNDIKKSRRTYDSWLDVVSRANDVYWIDISLNRGASTLSEDYDMSKTLIHEVQHVIQAIEGFARGGNVRSVLEDDDARNVFINELQNAQKYAVELLEHAKESGNEDLITLAQRAVNKWDAVARDFMDGDISKEKAYEIYRRLAGEVEARNAATRSDMTPEERRRSLAEETEDVLRGEQIVTYGDGVRFSISSEIEKKYPNWMDNQTPSDKEGKRGQNTQVATTTGTYKKVGKWIDENMGKDVKILDASSGLGLGTLALRKEGFDVEDIEPYAGKGREEQPTYGGLGAYQRAMDDGKQYDYIISNAVLNVIPDDWRSGVLHDMALLLKDGGKMFINTRKAGEEKGIKNKIELESPQEVLVGTPDKITSYQRFFTPQELKEYVERELGEGYTVEIANAKNSGTSGLAAVVVTKTPGSVMEGQPMFSLRGKVDTEPKDVAEVAAAQLSRGKVLWENDERGNAVRKGMKAETGYGDGEKRRFFGLLAGAEKGGRSIDEIAHTVWEECDDRGIPCDVDEAKEAVLDILKGAETFSDIRNFIRNRRYEEADERTRHEMDAYQAERDQHYLDEYGMTEDEYESYLRQSTEEMLLGSEEDRRKIEQLEGENERLKERLDEEKQQRDMGSPLVAFLNDQISGFKAEIERLKQEAEDSKLDAQRLDDVKKQVIDFIKKQYNAAWMPYMGKNDLNLLLNKISDAKTVRDLEPAMYKIQSIAANGAVRYMQSKIEKRLKLPKVGKNARGMAVARNVDDRTRRIFDNLFRSLQDTRVTGMEDAMDDLRKRRREIREEIRRLEFLKGDEEGSSAELDRLNEELEKVNEDMRDMKLLIEDTRHHSDSTTPFDTAEAKEELMKKLDEAAEGKREWTDRDTDEYIELVVKDAMAEAQKAGNEAYAMQREIDSTEEQLGKSYQRYRSGEISREEWKQERSEIFAGREMREKLVASAKMVQAEKLAYVEQVLSELYNGGHNSLRYQVAKDIERKHDILKNVYKDIKGKSYNTKLGTIGDEKKDISEKSSLWQMILSPLNSFEYMCKSIVKTGRGKDSYLYRHFIEGKDGVVQAQEDYLRGMREQKEKLDNKVKELFGIGNGLFRTGAWIKLAERSEDVEDNTGVFVNVGEPTEGTERRKVELPLSKANAMYIYMVWKMKDGRVKLENQGFDEDSMAQIEDFIGDKYKQLADWIQEEFLTATREKYNERYVEMYHTSMDRIENYVPLKINKSEISEKNNMEGTSGNARNTNLDTKAGSLIKRTHNVSSVDINKSAFDVISEHVADMEDWYAYVKVRRDLDTLLNSMHFRNQLNVNQPGSYRHFKEAAQVATQSEDIDPVTDWDSVLSSITKNIIGVNIAYRLNTALKQTLSAPAYLAYSTDPRFATMFLKNVGKTVAWDNLKWCYDNVETFRNRVNVGDIGDNRLSESIKAKDAGWSKVVDEYQKKAQKMNSVGMLPNRLIDAMTCAAGIRSIYEFEMMKANKYVKDAKLTGEEKEEYLASAREKALRTADIFYNGTQQSSHPAFLSKMQKARGVFARAYTAYQNSNLAYTRMMMEGIHDIRYDANFRKAIDRYTQQFMEEGKSEQEARAEARQLAIKNFWEDIKHIGVPILLKSLWVQGGRGLLGFFTNDDDDDEEEKTGLQKAAGVAEKAFMPLQGIPFANVGMGAASAVAGNYDWESNPVFALTEMGDLARDIVEADKKYGLVSPELAGKVMYRLLRFGGVDLQTLTNICIGVEGLVNDGHDYEDWMVDVMYMLNTPKSGRKEAARVLAKESKNLDEYAERVLLADGYMKRHPELARWLPQMKNLDRKENKRGVGYTIPEKEAKQIVEEYTKIEDKRNGKAEGEKESAPEEKKESWKDYQTNDDIFRLELLKKSMKRTKPYWDEYLRIGSDEEAAEYREAHPEVEQYRNLEDIKKYIDRWNEEANKGTVPADEAADSIKKELQKVKMGEKDENTIK